MAGKKGRKARQERAYERLVTAYGALSPHEKNGNRAARINWELHKLQRNMTGARTPKQIALDENRPGYPKGASIEELLPEGPDHYVHD